MSSVSADDVRRELDELQLGLNVLGISCDDICMQRFRQYIELLHEYKNKIHLLSLGDYQRIARKHVLPSVMAYRHVENCCTVCDIGAGAGFPSVPLKIIRPELSLTLFESVQKKARFLRHLVETLHLRDLKVVNSRAEYYRGPLFEVVLLRAVGKIKKLLRTIDHVVEPGGLAIFFKTHAVEQEIKAAHNTIVRRSFEVHVEKLCTPVDHTPLTLVVLRKSVDE